MVIKRDIYLNRLIERRENGMIKVVTGIRRCGKSFLLFKLYYEYLIQSGVDSSRIIQIPLDDDDFDELRESKKLSSYIKDKITSDASSEEKWWYVFLDEVQLCKNFEAVLNGLNRRENVDIYVTGSNSKFLSSDIITEFRGRGDEVRVYPLSFSEYYSAYKEIVQEDKDLAWEDYYTYGGLPLILNRKSDESKASYLSNLCKELYLKDIEKRYNLNGDNIMPDLLNVLASSVGSFNNPNKIANTFNSKGIKVSDKTIGSYISYLLDAFFISKAERYDIKGRRYIDSPFKFYFTDIGLRNAQLNFRQQEESHIMENIAFNELIARGYDVDVGIVEYNHKNSQGKNIRSQLEIDFVANKGSLRYYIQSALNIDSEEKRDQETNSLKRVPDSFRKIVVVRDDIIPWHDDNGILYIGIEQFLLDEKAIDN